MTEENQSLMKLCGKCFGFGVFKSGQGTIPCEFCNETGYEQQSPPFSQHRQWVGLTVEDWDEISDMPDSFDQGVVWAVRKLKEKNT